MLKVAIVLLLLATLVSLFSGLFFLVKDQGHGSRVVNSLTVRVVPAAATLALVAWGFYSGELNSHAPWHF
ncbi:twin transmembrane helix small protein [Pseudomonas aeruginosa]|uniref:twin transmembrane helix small protein n=1 Tax=Pseudomonas aeruginosa TaxID=287 RepID=UPI001068539E|nr:twin transmembrane helix small protein [Pseudomonas aeruginosa]TEL73293.1 twin transmembrane helix small protein [Pseudomonas aeruginosa]